MASETTFGSYGEKPRGFEDARQISGPTALANRLPLAQTQQQYPGSRFMPPPPRSTAPEVFPMPPPPARRPILRSIDEDVGNVPPPPLMAARSGPPANLGRFLTGQNVPMPVMPPLSPESPEEFPQRAAAATPVVMPKMPPMGSPQEDFIPIMHKRIPEKIRTRFASPPPVPKDAGDDGFTPVTPGQSRSATTPRDVLGIPVSKFIRSKSRREPRAPHDEYEDVTPLSPSADRDLEVAQKPKSQRKTLFGVLEGWWDLNLLDRGKSLRRK